MKAKTIKSVLRSKMNELIASIDNDAIKKVVQENAIVTGGSIASALMGEAINDFDVYFKTREATFAIAKYYVEKFKANPPPRFKASGKEVNISVIESGERIKIFVKSAGIAGDAENNKYQYFEQVTDEIESQAFIDKTMQDAKAAEDKGKPKYRPVFMSSNAITLSDDIQIVIRFYGMPDQIHENFDFVHCTCSWDAATGELRLPPAALESMLAKDLRYKTSKYPLCSIIRTRKFLARGWRISAGQYVKMTWDLNKLNLSDIHVLEDQMIGVDSAYFQQVIELLKKNGGDKVDGTYLMEVIDRVF